MMFSKRIPGICVAIALTLGAGAGAGSASAAPQGPWVQPAADLSAAGFDANSPQVTTAPDGSATAVWSRSNGTNSIIQAATRKAGGSFGAPVDLSAPGQNALDPHVSTASDGTTTAIWERFNGINIVIQSATRPPGGTFGAPIILSSIGVGLNAGSPQITAAPDGTTTVVWRRSNGTNEIVQAATRPAGGPFGAPVDLSVAGQTAFAPQIATAPDGAITAVWYLFNGTGYVVQASTRPPGGSFGSPIDLTVSAQNVSGPQISTAPDGSATAVWARTSGTNVVIQASTRPPGGAFGAPVDLSASGQDASAPQITAPDGTTTVTWKRSNGTHTIIQAATRPPGGSFGVPVGLSAIGQNAFEPQVTAAPDGTATAIWRLQNGTIQAATRPPGGAFGTPVDLSAVGAGLIADTPQIAVGPDGTATATWRRLKGGNYGIQSISTAQPSVALRVAKSGSGTVKSSAAGINCGADCTENYLSFSKVVLTATPNPGNTFSGWGGACEEATGNTCELAMLKAENATAAFKATSSNPPPSGKARLKISKVVPRKPSVKRGKKVKIKVTARNTGDVALTNAKLCVKLRKNVKRKLKLTGKFCRKLGDLGADKSRILAFRLRATPKAKRGRKYRVTFELSGAGATSAERAVVVKVR